MENLNLFRLIIKFPKLVIFILVFFAISSSCRPFPSHAKQLHNKKQRENKDEMKKRNLEVGIHVNIPTTKQPQYYGANLGKLEAMLANVLANRPQLEGNYSSIEDCPNCDKEEVILPSIIQPAYPCDEWEPKHRVCTLERNIGDTVTFYLSTGEDERMRHPNITWKRVFHMRGSKEKNEYTIDPQNTPENIIIGRKGYELRVSPITETDVGNNMFSATIQSHASSKNKLYFMIRIVAIDLGFVYVGEVIELNLRKFVSLPEQSVSFKWFLEKDGEHGTLPSNMKVSVTGSSIKISELRQQQEGILACSVYTNLHVLATKKRFLIKDLSKNKDVLQSSPNNTLKFKEEYRKKRYRNELIPYLSSLRNPRQKRRVAEDDIDRAFLVPTSTDEDIGSYTTSQSRYDNKAYNESPYGGPPFADNEQLVSQADMLADEINAPGNKPIMNQPNNSPNEFDRNPQKYLVNKAPPKNDLNKIPLLDITANPPNMQRKQNIPQSVNGKQGMQYTDQNIQTNGLNPNQQDNSNIVLNIGGIEDTRKVTAEVEIAQLISYCFSGTECSTIATCVRNKREKVGFCKCLPGAHGVGIFCREDVWLTNNKIDVEEIDLDSLGYTNNPSLT